MKYSGVSNNRDIRQEASKLIHSMCMNSKLALQMFIACKGLPALVQFLQYKESKFIKFLAHWLDEIETDSGTRKMIYRSIDIIVKVITLRSVSNIIKNSCM